MKRKDVKRRETRRSGGGARVWAGLIAVASVFAGASVAEEAQQPDPEWIVEMARGSYARQDYNLEASLRQGFKRTPFRLSMQDGMIWFQFTKPDQTIHLEMKDDGYLLRESATGKGGLVAQSRYAEPVRETDISYEDLSMRFLFWPNPKYLGEEKVRTALCWKVAVANPDSFGPYASVILWVDQRSGGLAQITGMDEKGRVLRKFLVTKVQQIDGVWMLEQMRVERYDAGTGKVAGRTYLEIVDPGKKKVTTFKK